MYDVSLSWYETIDRIVQAGLDQQGSKLMPYTVPKEVVGESIAVVQSFVGEARYIEGQGELTKFTPITFDKRRIMPKGIELDIHLNMIDAIKQGGIVDPGILASQCLNKIGKKVDEIILEGIGGGSYSYGAGKDKLLSGAKEVTAKIASNTPDKNQIWEYYDATQTIPWNDCTLLGNKDRTPLATQCGLSVAKINRAVQKIRAAYAGEGPLILYGSPYAMSTLMSDELCSNVLYNTQPAMSTGQANPVSGISAIVTGNIIETNQKSATKADGTKANGSPVNVEYAYIFAQQHIMLGCSLPMTMDQMKDAARSGDPVMFYKGLYGCTRMWEEAVVRIEIAHGIHDNTGLVY